MEGIKTVLERISQLEVKMNGLQAMIEDLFDLMEVKQAEAEADREGYVPLERVKAELG